MNRLWIRSAAMSCAFASCAMVVGPGLAGAAIAHADLFGGIDFFGDCDKKSDMHHPRPGSDATPQSTRTTASIAAAEAPTAKIGSQPETLSATEAGTANRALASVPGSVAISQGGGGGLASATNAAVRAANLPRVSSAPVTRSIVIRGTPRATAPVPALVPSPESPVAVPLAAPPPVVPEPELQPAPGGPPEPSTTPPLVRPPLAHSGSGVVPVPDSYRAGYAEYLKSASTSDLIFAALPGVAGIAGFTLVGAYAGYRQARAVQRALLAPVPTSIVL